MLLLEKSDENRDEFIDLNFEWGQSAWREDLIGFEALEPKQGFIRFAETIAEFGAMFGGGASTLGLAVVGTNGI